MDKRIRWQQKTEKEYLCVRNGEERGFTAAEFKTAQAEGWEKQYPYKPKKVQEQQNVLQARQAAVTHEYAETLAAVAPEDLPEVQRERRNIRYGGRTALIQKLHGIYGDYFDRRLYDSSKKSVDSMLSVREIPQERKSDPDDYHHKQETRTSRIFQSLRQVRVSALVRLNRRVPNGTHGGVGGRSLN